MKLFKRRHQNPSAEHPADEPLGDVVSAVVVVVEDEADEARRAVERDEAWETLRRIVAEAVIRQDEAENLLAGIREREPLATLAPRGGRLVSRFVALRADLPHLEDAALRRHVSVLEKVFDHHALMLTSSLDLLAGRLALGADGRGAARRSTASEPPPSGSRPCAPSCAAPTRRSAEARHPAPATAPSAAARGLRRCPALEPGGSYLEAALDGAELPARSCGS